MDCVVEGIIEAKHVDALEVLLQGLCGSHRESVKVHEICLKTGPNLRTVPSEVHPLMFVKPTRTCLVSVFFWHIQAASRIHVLGFLATQPLSFI
ncbi:hypothetical protein BDL97_05G080500 [Sphagnum fallax]|nr:hypothetical protein BDL97_05G080500 [Sphagnum fallax]